MPAGMPELEPIKTGASAHSRASGHRSSRSRNNSTSRPQLRHVFSGRHLDDHSVYHGNDDDLTQNEGGDWVEDESDFSEQVAKDENEKAEEDGVEETSEVRGGVLTERDLEASLERKQTKKSVKDQNLVRI